MKQSRTSFSFFFFAIVIDVFVGAMVYIFFHNIFYAFGAMVTIALFASHGDPRNIKR